MSAALTEAARAALQAWQYDSSDCRWHMERLEAALAAAEQPAEPVGLFDIRAIVQQAALALEELGGPGYLIGGVMHHRIGLILPKLNEAIDALAAAPAAPAQAPTEPAGVPIRAPFDHCRPSGIAYDLPGLVFTASQLREALAFFGGEEGDEDDPVTVTIALRDAGKDIDGEPRPRGLYVWMTEYPEEGSIVLDGIGSQP